jgi:hypothetical protein
MTEKQQHPLRCETCGHYHGLYCPRDYSNTHGNSDKFEGMHTQVDSCGCASHTDALTLTPALQDYYAARAKETGKEVGKLVLADLTALWKKRVAREDRRVFKEIEYERL